MVRDTASAMRHQCPKFEYILQLGYSVYLSNESDESYWYGSRQSMVQCDDVAFMRKRSQQVLAEQGNGYYRRAQ